MALDAKVITYWQDHGIDLLNLTRIEAAENLLILLKNETKPWLREAAIVTVSKRIEHRCRALGKLATMRSYKPSTPIAIRSIGVPETSDGIDNE